MGRFNNHRRQIMTIHNGKALHLHRKALFKLESPPYIRFWWGEAEQVLLVTGWWVNSDSSLPVSGSRVYRDKRGFRTRNTVCINAILSRMGLSSGESYAFVGDYVPEMNMLAFRLQEVQAEKIKLTASPPSAEVTRRKAQFQKIEEKEAKVNA